MKKVFLVITTMLVLAMAVGGCATKGDLEAVEAREKAMAVKADQAAQDAEEARMAADEAITKANEAMDRAEQAEKRANEREALAAEKERMAEEKAKEVAGSYRPATSLYPSLHSHGYASMHHCVCCGYNWKRTGFAIITHIFDKHKNLYG
jgi:murein lipoprotein